MDIFVYYCKKLGALICRNLAYILWFLFFFYSSCSLLSIFNIKSKNTSFYICIVLYAISLLVAFVFGEQILRLVNHARPVETSEEKEYFLPIFERTLEEVRNIDSKLPEIKPHIVDSIGINAFAIGKHTVAVTKGALETFSEEELQSVILHEIAHIRNGNTTAEILNKVGNGVFSVLIIIINLLFTLFDYILWDIDESAQEEESRHPRTFFLVIRLIFNLYIQLLLFIGNLFLARNSRKSELLADKFAFELGHGEDMISALYLLQKLSLSDNRGLVEQMQAKHPRISLRIEELEDLLEIEEQSA